MRRRASLVATAATVLALVCGAVPAVGVTPSSAVAPPASDPAPDPASGPAPAAAPDPTTGDVPEDRGPVPAFEAPVEEPAADVPTQVLVRFTAGTTTSQQRSALGAAESTPEGSVAGTGFTVVDVGDRDPAAVAAELADDPRVADVQVDHVRRVTAWTDDPFVDYTWPYLDLMRLPRAWDESTGAEVVVAVLDTGVSADHPDLVGAVVPGVNLVDPGTAPVDDNGHGTMVTGIVASTPDNGLGHVGAAPHARVLPVKVLDGSGRGSDSVVAEGITYAVEHGAKVVNLSLGGPDESPVLLAAMQQAVAAGAVVVVAAGNESTDVTQYPAAYAAQVDGVLAVSATDDDGSIAGFSSWGDWVSIAAPGSDIVSTYGSGYSYGSGTSYAAPFVSGAAALVLSTAPRTAPAAVEDRLVLAARDAGPRGTDPFYGHGVLDAAAALGVTPALPLDRTIGDGGGDDLPAGATVLARQGTGSEPVSAELEAEGDVDWYRFEAATAGRYVIRAEAVSWDMGVEVEARDAQGRELRSGSNPLFHSAMVTVDGVGPWLIAVRGRVPSVDAARYGVQVTWATPQPPAVELAFGPAEALAPPRSHASSGFHLADATGDGNLDAVMPRTVFVANPDGSTGIAPAVGLYPGTAGGAFDTFREVRLGTARGLGPQAQAADVDGDGTSEIVAVTDSEVWLVRAPGGVLTPSLVAQVPAHGRLTAADLDGDGDVDLMVATAAGVLALVGDGVGGFEPRTVPTWTEATAPRVAFVDMDDDGALDVVRPDGPVLVQQTDGSFVAGPTHPSLAEVTKIDTAVLVDVTGDGLMDVVHENGSAVRLVPGVEGATFGPAVTLGTFSDVTGVGTADVDGDGLPDVVAHRGWEFTSVSLQRPGGGFLEPQLVFTDDATGPVVVRDHDGDGDGDLLYPHSPDGIRLQRQVSSAVVPGPASWVLDSTPAPHTTGLASRPRVTVTSGQDLEPTSVTDRTVRLVDGTTGRDVDAARGYDAATRTVSVTPSADLSPGHHYELVVTDLAATDGDRMTTSFRTWFTVGAAGARFTPVQPYRVLDTRGSVEGWVAPGVPRVLDLSFDVPVDATAVVLNVVAASPSAVGNVRVYPTPGPGEPIPASSNINVVPGVDQPNLVTVPVSPGRRVSLLTDGPTAHLVADIAGYYSPGGATGFVPRDPVRMLDTRTGVGAPTGPVRGGQLLDLQVTGRDGVPDDASAVVLNLTATGVTAPTYVGAFPAPAASEDQTPPLVSNLNLLPGRDQANLVTVRVGDGGRVRLYAPFGGLHLIADLAGYYSPTGDHGFVPLDPARVSDTRTGVGVRPGVAPGRTPVDVTVAGRAGVPAGAAAAVLNVVGVGPRGDTHVRAFPTTVPASLPTVSMLNLVAGRDEANLGILRLGDAGRVTFYPGSADVHLVVDVFGYFRRDAP